MGCQNIVKSSWVMLFTVLFVLSCEKSATKAVRSATTGKTSAEPTETSVLVKKDENSIVDSDALKLVVPANAYAEDAIISIRTMDEAAFIELAKLETGTLFSSVPVDVNSKNATETTKLEPSLPLSATIYVKDGAVVNEQTIAVVVSKNQTTGESQVFYVPYSEFKFTPAGSSKGATVDIPKLQAGNFQIALVSGVTADYIASHFEKLPESGLMSGGTSINPPMYAATSTAFTDNDGQVGKIGGSLIISKASNEADIVDYVVYWGSSATTKHDATPYKVVAKTGGNLTVNIPANTAIPTGPLASHFLVCTRNAYGEKSPCVSTAIIDLGVPVNAAASVVFTDTDPNGNELAGNIDVTKAGSEVDVTAYVIYWGSNSSTKLNTTPIGTLTAANTNLSYTLASDTAIPAGATHILVFTKNADGEMATGVSTLIVDLGVPTAAPTSVAFTDTDYDGNEVAGDVDIGMASSEADVTHYVIYFGKNSTEKQGGAAIATVPVTGSNLTYTIPDDTVLPSSPKATHILVFSKNAEGEMATGVSVAITDKGVPLNGAASVAITDTDIDGGELAGTVNITKATVETDITHYVLYWGSDATTKQSGTAIASIAKTGSNLTYTIPANTVIPTSPTATHLLVFAKNLDGERLVPTAATIVDKGVPVNAAVSMSFTDGDNNGGKISGAVTITKAAQEGDISHYVLYWGSNSSTKQSSTPVANIAKTGSNVTYTFAANSSVPTSPAATHLLVYTKNADGEMATGISLAIVDAGVPTLAATSVAFTDADPNPAEIQGTVTISKASSEANITHYVLYWGSSATVKQSSTAIADIAVTGSNVTHTFAANTPVPSSPAATHLLVYSKNADGEMATGVAVAINDVGVPSNAAASIAFTDSDPDVNQLQGAVTITKAGDESDLTHYVLYWGSDATTKQSTTPIANIAKTGSNVTHTFAANTALPAGATHLLVFTKNADGEMATGVDLLIVDKGVPSNAAVSASMTDSDPDGGELQGVFTIVKATSESRITDYVMYWGTNSTTKLNSTPIATLPATGSNVTHTFAADTAIPATVTHILVFTQNGDGEMATGINYAITDLGVPKNAAVSLSFTDTDLNGGKLGGTLNITKATAESDVTHYVVYWGTDATTKQSGTAITNIAKTGSNLTYSVASNTSIPASATHFLVYTKNADGEMATPVAVQFVDKGVPVHAAASISFTDLDPDGSELEGTVTINMATDESDLTHYVLYWGSNSTTKQSTTAIATLAATGSNVTHTFAANSAKPAAASHLLVYTKNADGEMSTPTALAIVDKGIPTAAAASISFTDTDTTAGEVAGTVTITKATNETSLTHYNLYWGTNSTTKQSSTAIVSKAKTGSNVTHTFAADTPIPSGATHLLVFTENADGEMATGTSLAIVDKGVPTAVAAGIAFTDTDNQTAEIAGTLTITKATSETDITHYVLYWGSNATTKQSGTAIATIAKTGSNVTHTFSANTPVPSGATHFLVYTTNADGESITPVALAIDDLGLPVNQAAGVAFTDTDSDVGEIAGTLTITKATDESDLTHYVVYWGSSTTVKQNTTAITTIAKTGSNVTYTVPSNTAIPSGATHFLVYTKNANGEMATPVALAITDSDGSTCAGSDLTNSPFANWAGSDPGGTIIICTAAQFKRIFDGSTYNSVTSAARMARNYQLNGHIDMAGETFTPIGNSTTNFTGNFNGQNFSIKNITLTGSTTYLGLFAYVGTAGIVRNLKVTVSAITSTSDYVGGVVGYLAGRMENVEVRGASGAGTEVIQANQTVGALVGGFAGDTSTRIITESRAKQIIVRAKVNYLGGLVGYIGSGAITKSFASVTVNWNGTSSANLSYVGGFAGYLQGNITDSYSTSSVSINTTSGSYTGVGGFAGYMGGGTLSNNYVSGAVCSSGDCSAASSTDGPFLGSLGGGTVTNNYWNTTTTGWATGSNAIKRTTAEMQDKYNYMQRADLAFNFATIWRIPSGGGMPILQWQEPLGSAVTVASLYDGGDGSTGTPWLISTEDQLRNFATAYQVNSAVLSHEFKINADITMTGKAYPWGSLATAFNGKIRGNNKTISNLSITGYADFVGLFGNMGTSSLVENLTVTVSSIDGTGYSYVGPIAGQTTGKVTNVHTRGASGASTEVVIGANWVGGLIGVYGGDGSTRVMSQCSAKQMIVRNTSQGLGGLIGVINSGNVSQSFSSVTVNWAGVTATTPNQVGGFTGYTSGNLILDSYSTSSVTINTSTPAPTNIGGFIGIIQGGNVSHSYAMGNVCSGNCANSTSDGPFFGALSSGTLINNYWSSTGTGWSSIAQNNAYMRTGTEMQNMYNYVQRIDSAFNFMTVWRIPSGGGYPILQWQEPLGSAYTVAGLFAGGTGASGNPWQISTEDQLRNIPFAYQISTAVAGHEFILNNDIALTYRMHSLGTSAVNFQGKFRGNNRTISNLILDGTADYVGLLGFAGTTSVIENLTLTINSVNGYQYSFVGTVAGTSQGKIDNVQVRGVSGGGTEVVQSAGMYLGGLIGSFAGDTSSRIITNSSVKDLIVRSTLNGSSSTGGFIGYTSGDIRRSFSNVSVNWAGTTGQSGSNIGGFIGQNQGSNVSNCYSRSAVTYNTPSSAGTSLSGFIGYQASGVVSHNYMSANVCSGNCNNSASDGPFFGTWSAGTSTNNYYDTTVSGWTNSTSNNVFKRTTTELQDMYNYVQRADTAFDFMTVWRIPSGGGLPIFQWQEALGSAYTLSSLFAGGAGTSGSPWQIATEDQLRNIAFAYYLNTSIMSAEFILTADIAITKRIPSLGTSTVPFQGKFHGNNKTISNLIMDGTVDHIGLFGYAGTTSLIENLTVTVNSIDGGVQSYVGAVAGTSQGKIDNVHVRGVSGASTEVITAGGYYTGGLVGNFAGDTSTRIITQSSVKQIIVRSTNNGNASLGGFVGYNSGLIQKSFAAATVNWAGTTGQAAVYVGGFVGNNNSNITNAYSQSTVTINTPSSAPTAIGGFVGIQGGGTLTSVYHTGNVCSGNCNNSTTDGAFYGQWNSGSAIGMYWDSTTTGWSTTQNNTFMRTQAQMQDMYTYIQRADYQFDFMTIWRIPSGGGYPIFQWQEPLGSAYTVAGLFNGGNGSAGTPYEIATEAQLRNLAAAYLLSSTILNQEFKLTANIALTSDISPFGTASVPFNGKFNGGNYTISNLSMVGFANDVGLFGNIGTTGEIKDLKIAVTKVDGNGYSYVGALAGTINGKVTNVHVYGASGASTELISTSGMYLGGFAGSFNGNTTTRTITNSSVKELIVRNTSNASGNVGGFLGYSAGLVSTSYSAVAVNWAGTTGQSAYYMGGFIGNNNSDLTNNYSKSAVTVNTPSNAPTGIGGFIGFNGSGTVSNNYQSANVCSGNCNNSTTDGPFYGQWNSGTSTNNYWDTTTSGWTGTQNNTVKRTTTELGDMYLYVKNMATAFNFMTVWRIPSGGGPAIFQWQEPLGASYVMGDLFAGGDGSTGNPYQISTESQLRNIPFAYQLNTAAKGYSYILTSNIALTKNWPMLGNASVTFSGRLYGANYTISNLTIDGVENYSSLLGYCDTTCQVENLTLTVSSVTGNAFSYVGALAGYMAGKVSNVHVRGVSGAGTEVVSSSGAYLGGVIGAYAGDTSTRTITNSSIKQLIVRTSNNGSSYTGGFVGDMSSGQISNSSANVAVNWAGTTGQVPNVIGGFVGNMSGTILDCYSLSPVTLNTPSGGPTYIGGFAGWGYSGSFTRAYSAGSVCAGNCSNSTTDGPFAGSNTAASYNQVFWSDASGFSTHGIGTKVTDASLTTDTNANSIVDALDSAGFSTGVWVLDPATLGGAYPKFVYQ